MKAIIFFIKDNDTNEYTDFKSESGYYDLNDFKRHFENTTIDFKDAAISRKIEALTMLCQKLDYDSEAILNRLFIKRVE